MKNRNMYLGGVFALLILCVGCATPPRSVYVPTTEPGFDSNAPRPQDTRLVVEDLVRSMFNEWDFASTHPGKIPVIAFTGTENRTPYRWEDREIIGWIEQEIVRSRKATFSNAIDPSRRGGRSGHQYRLIDFQTDPDNPYVDRSTAARLGGIQAPDYELFGTIYNYQELHGRGFTEVNFVLEMTLSRIETGTTVWKKMSPIRKNVPR